MQPTMYYLTEIYFEDGALRGLPDVLRKFGVVRPLLVTDAGLLRLGLIERLPLQPAAVFSDVPANPTEDSVLAGREVFRGMECDGVLAVGGGSPLDCAKAIALVATHEPPLEQYALLRGGVARITPRKPPVIAVPTTAGTGSEVGRAALISFRSGVKLALVSPHLIPTAAVCDPELTYALPPMLTAATGMDAISHCVETFCSPKFNPVAEAIALDGLGRACRFLPDAVLQGASPEPRREMLMAALQGGLTFQKGLGMIHSLSHPLGAVPGKPLHHGTLNAIFLPHVLAFNMSACPEKLDRIAAAVGAKCREELPAFFSRLRESLGLPGRLSQLGVTAADLEPLAEPAFQDHSTPTNPRPFTADDCRAVYLAAL